MRVFALLNSLAPGGTERSTIALAPHLRELGVSLEIVTLRSAAHELRLEAESADIPVRTLRPGPRRQQLIELRRLLAEQRPDILHTALFDADILGRLASWRLPIPVISSLVNTPYDPSRLTDPNVSRWRLRTVQAIDALTGHLFVDLFHAVSVGAAEANSRALRIPLGRVFVAERGREVAAVSGSATAVRADVRREFKLRPTQKIVLNVGRQEHQKAQVNLVRALPALVEHGIDAALLIAGRSGNASEDLGRAIDELDDHRDRVHLLGHRSDVARLLCAADVLVVASHFEGTAGAAIEAMAVGTPIVSTAVTGIHGILDDGRNALLVAPDDFSALAGGVERVLSSSTLRLHITSNAADDWQVRFTADAAARRMHLMYDTVIARSSRTA